MMSPAMTALVTVAMMLAMMLPSFAPSLWRYHRHLHAMRIPGVGQRTALFIVGYVGVWTIVGLMLFAMSAELSPMAMAPPTNPPFGAWAGAVVLCAGVIQCSRWKARQLLRCRQACVTVRATPRTVLAAWADGCRLGVDCGLSCTAPMAILLVVGLMDARMMVVITLAITAERVVPAGARIARLTGVF